MRVLKLKESYPAYKAQGMEVLGFFQSPRESLEKYISPLAPPFAIAPDPDHRIYDLFHIETSWPGLLKVLFHPGMIWETMKRGLGPGRTEGAKNLLPADFLIDQDLNIGRAFYARDITEHMPLEEIDFWVGAASLRHRV